MNIKEELLNNPLKLFQYVGGSVLALVLLSGAGSLLTYRISNPDRTISFKKDMVLNVSAEKNTISLVSAVGNTSVDTASVNYKENKIVIDDYELSAEKVDTSVPGEYEVAFTEKKNAETSKTTKKVVVKDIEKPKIVLKEKKAAVDVSNLGDFKLEEYYDKKDNYSIPEDITVSVTKIEKKVKNKDKNTEEKKRESYKYIEAEIDDNDLTKIEDAGEYRVTLEAKDTSGNKSKSVTFMLNISDSEKEKEKEEEEKLKENDEIEEEHELEEVEESVEENNSTEQPQQSSAPGVTPQPEPVPAQPQPSTPAPVQPSNPTPSQTQTVTRSVTAENKVFYTRDYNYSLSALESAVMNYGENMVNSGRANGYSYSPYSQNGTIVGYRIVFK